jgi:hypothetical protein
MSSTYPLPGNTPYTAFCLDTPIMFDRLTDTQTRRHTDKSDAQPPPCATSGKISWHGMSTCCCCGSERQPHVQQQPTSARQCSFISQTMARQQFQHPPFPCLQTYMAPISTHTIQQFILCSAEYHLGSDIRSTAVAHCTHCGHPFSTPPALW